MTAWPHLHSTVSESYRSGTFRLSLMNVIQLAGDTHIEFSSFGTLDEIQATAERILSDVAEQRIRLAERGRT